MQPSGFYFGQKGSLINQNFSHALVSSLDVFRKNATPV